MDVSQAAPADTLRGFRIGVTSDRRSADLIAALERRGAQVMHAPALMIVPNDQDDSLIIQTRTLITARPDVVLVTTGYGMRRWLEVADAAGLGAELTATLEAARIFARGPKAHGAVRAAGLLDAQTSDLDTTASLVDAVIAAGLSNRRVAVQLHGYTDEIALSRLAEISDCVMTVTPYRWARPNPPERLARLIRAACQRQLEALTFTSAPAAAATLEAAEALRVRREFVQAHSDYVASAAVGPVTAEPLREAGIDPVVPDRYRLGALVRLVTEELTQRHIQRFSRDGVIIELRGGQVSVNDCRVSLGPNSLALLVTLASSSSSVLSRHELIACLPDNRDDHALHMAMSRLRRALDVPGLITTIMKRGYRFNAERID
ncbi:MAG TPA: uroporphyrinogen-III synthase [Propionibacteriaceae bacterium]|nr:uroporphyrinogen-III synthase [Propionibacteriaceae bacterium]